MEASQSKFVHLQEQLGQPLTAADVAAWLGVDDDFVRRHYQDFGGVRIGKGRRGRLLFFDNLIVEKFRRNHALQSGETGPEAPVGCIGDEGGQACPKNVRHEKGSNRLGKRAKKAAKLHDPYGLLDES